jgi:hypothetical protein
MTVSKIALQNALDSRSPRVELLAALHWHMVPPFAQETPELGPQVELIARCVAAQVGAIIPQDAGVDIDFAMSSTVISGAVSGMEPVSRLLFDSLESLSGVRPMAFLHTYMCAGWGYALRYFSRHTNARLVMISIIDVDIHDLAYHRQHPLIGNMGFGISTILLRLPDCRDETAETGGPYADSAFKEFIRALKLHNARRKPVLTFIPFFGANLGSIAEKIMGKSNLGVNQHDLYGHCFGSDPWIGVIEWLQKHPLADAVNVTAGAVAFSGYYTLCDIGISPHTQIGMRYLGGSETELAAAIAERPALHFAGAGRCRDVDLLNEHFFFATGR